MPPCRRPHGTVFERFAPTPAYRLSKNATKRGTNLCNDRSHGRVHIYCTVLATNSAQNVAFSPYLLSITMPIGFSFPESSRHYISSEKQRSEFAVWEVKNPRTLHQQKTAKRFLIQYKYCSLVWIFFTHRLPSMTRKILSVDVTLMICQ